MSKIDETSRGELETLLDFIKQNRGFDFTGYKRPTLQRRIQKRMGSVGADGFSHYREYLGANPDEFGELFNTILINVTGFFRDPQAWEFVRDDILPRIVEARRGQPIRVWSTGCATGEEAYTVAMLLAEAVGDEEFSRRVKIYATDVDEEALNIGRQGRYAAELVEPIPDDLRERYLEGVNDRFVLRGDLRRGVIFGRHDLLQDPPISRVDLLLARNTLMYFTADAQGRVLAHFHFSLNEDGYLFLGKSEVLLTRSSTFVPVDLKRRVFSPTPKIAFRERLLNLVHGDGQGPTGQSGDRESAFDSSPIAQLVVDEHGALSVASLPRNSHRMSTTPSSAASDVTQRRHWEDEIRALKTELELRIDARAYEVEQMTARLAAVLRELPEGVIIVGHNGEVQLANRRAQDLLDGADAFATEAVARALQGEETRAARTELERGDEMLVVEYATTPVRDAAGEVVAAVLTFQDVTDRELRERAQRDFVTNAAHELQTPLAAIASAVQVLKAGAKDDVKTRDRFLDHIDQAVNRLDRLTRALLVLARAQTREEPPRHEVIELRPLLEDVASALRPSAVPVTVSCAKDTAVIANRPLLEQALVNLGGNALKHSRSRVVLGARRVDGLVMIDVTDSGAGIPPWAQSRIFDRFYRVGDREGDGFGLGLAIVREAVDALNGELDLESSPNGTRVSIGLPGARVRVT